MTTLHLSASDVFVLAFEDVVNPSILYALCLPIVIRAAGSSHAFCAAASSLAGALLVVALMPSLGESLWAILGMTAVLAVLSILQWRDLQGYRAGRGEAEILLTLVVFVSFLLCLAVLGFALVTGIGGSGVRPLLATVMFLLAYRWLVPWFRREYGARVGWFIASAGLLLLCARGLVWYQEFSSLPSASPFQVGVFPNIDRLRAVSGGLHQLQEGELGKSVTSLRKVLRRSDPETIPLRVTRWSGLDRESLAMVLAFGGRAPLERQNPALSFSWDRNNQRLLVLGANGRILALTAAGPPSDLGTPLPDAIAVSASRDGTRIGLLSANGSIYVVDQDGREAWKLALPEDTYRDLAAAEVPDRFLALREDGAVFSVTPQGTQLLEGYPTWPDTNPAISIVVTPDGKGHYVLDRFGGVHPRGQTAISYNDLGGHAQTNHYWPGKDIARSIGTLSREGYPVYLDLYGGLHAITKTSQRVSYRGNDYPPLDEPIAVDLIVGMAPRMVHVLCRDGSIIPIPERGWLLPPGDS